MWLHPKKGVDYNETYSQVARSDSLRFFLTLCAALGIQPHKMDVTGAFLYSVPDEDLYMRQSDGYADSQRPTWVWKLLKSLYGLKHAPRVWHQTIDPHLQSLGFCPIQADPCIYLRWNNSGNFSLIFLHVDDLLILPGAGDSIDTIKKSLSTTFAMTDDGPADHVLGIKLDWDLAARSVRLSCNFYLILICLMLDLPLLLWNHFLSLLRTVLMLVLRNGMKCSPRLIVNVLVD